MLMILDEHAGRAIVLSSSITNGPKDLLVARQSFDRTSRREPTVEIMKAAVADFSSQSWRRCRRHDHPSSMAPR
jgi:hypothetical protein